MHLFWYETSYLITLDKNDEIDVFNCVSTCVMKQFLFQKQLSKAHSSSPWRGNSKAPKQKRNQNKRMGNNRRSQSHDHICRNCIQLWGKWNANGNPIIRTLKERIKVFENGEDPESDEKTDSEGEYLEKEKTGNKNQIITPNSRNNIS
ncbi:hypothetical protein M0813_18652 [Anaeramoeba flamelloides]|uniref:Uncharacterized protein n=1 Tax=Anaeramoeba flamelloides TaxID=1746091 RepID=A0ABQ8YR83_9EUKA|nr:hypothetical protein M0813_18652 [Anaeramoeba flamelloides]